MTGSGFSRLFPGMFDERQRDGERDVNGCRGCGRVERDSARRAVHPMRGSTGWAGVASDLRVFLSSKREFKMPKRIVHWGPVAVRGHLLLCCHLLVAQLFFSFPETLQTSRVFQCRMTVIHDKLPQVTLLSQSNELVSLMTIIRNKETPRNDFIFYSNPHGHVCSASLMEPL